MLVRILFILVVVFVGVFGTSSANATTQNWAVDIPQLVGRSEVPNGAPQDSFACGGTESSIQIDGYGLVNRACVFGNTGTTRIARAGLLYAVAFPENDQFYELRGICPKPKCAYAPINDALLMHHYIGNSNYGIGLYKNVSQHLKKHFDTTVMRNYFQFEPPGDPNFILKAGDSQPQVESVAFSQSGKYAIIELRSYGFVRLDTDTFEVRRVIAPSSTYGLLYDPYYELAITNDGSTVALAGYRGDTALYSIDSTCGDQLESLVSPQFGWGVEKCQRSLFSIDTYFSDFYQTFNPRFNVDGSRFALSVLRRDGLVERLVFGLSSRSLDYLALGDSYTSGEGEESDMYYKASSGGDVKCHLSARSYPYLIADVWGVDGQSVACSGARTVDIVANNETYLGQSQLLSTSTQSQVAQAREDAIGYFQPGVIPQAWFVSEYQPRIVSLGIGGNDVGLVGKLSGCLNIGICEWVSDATKRLSSAKEIGAVYSKVREVISAILNDSPATRVVVVGYPLIINDTAYATCDPLINLLLQPAERTFINESIRYLNQTVRAASYAEGAAYVDTEDAFHSNKLCDTTNNSAMNGVRLGNDIAPLSILEDFRVFGSESFHPTAIGHKHLAQKILQAIPLAESIKGCGECAPTTVPPPGLYWGDQSGEYARQISSQFANKDIYAHGDDIIISSSKMLFLPNSSVVAEIHSNVIELARGQADQNGSFDVNASVPKSLPPGYHTLHLIGEAPDGQAVDVYQTVSIAAKESSNSNYIGESNNISPFTEANAGVKNSLPIGITGNYGTALDLIGSKPILYPTKDTLASSAFTTVEAFLGNLASAFSGGTVPILLPLSCVGVLGIGIYFIVRHKRRHSQDRGG